MGKAFDRVCAAFRDNGLTVIEAAGDRAYAQAPGHSAADRSVSIRSIDGAVLVHCHAGEQLDDVLAVVGLQIRDLYDDPKGATYDYPDGRQVHRTPEKKFRQSGNTKGRSLFHVDRLGDAEVVYVVEGEKDVLAVESVGGVAVCSAMGAGKAHLFDWDDLRGRTVFIVADRDEPGRGHANAVAGLLRGKAKAVRIVEAAVGKDAADHIGAGKSLDEFVHEDIDGDELLNEVEAMAGRYLAFPSPHCITVIVLWIAHTWALSAFYVTPRLVLDSPEPGSGKTRVLEVLALLCRAAKVTLSTTTAALYRRIAAAGEAPPTVLQDEADAVFGKNSSPQAEDLRALFNAGYKRGATVDRCEGDSKNMKVVEFPVFAPVALAGLAGRMPQTILDRSVTIHMRRRAPDEHVAEFRERDASAAAGTLRDKLDAWASGHLDLLTAARPAMPQGVRDRPAEVWEALLAVADAAGGGWPERARDACRHFVLNSDPDELSFGARLLRDVRAAFKSSDRMFSADLISALTGDAESEWADLWGKPLDQSRLAKELKRYGVRSKSLRIGEARAKGYQVDGDDGLEQAWRRYLPTEPSAIGGRDKRDSGDIAGQPVTPATRSRDTRDVGVTAEISSEQGLFGSVTVVTPVTPTNGYAVPGGLTPTSPGQTDRVRAALANAAGAAPVVTGPDRCERCSFHVPTQGHRDGCPNSERTIDV